MVGAGVDGGCCCGVGVYEGYSLGESGGLERWCKWSVPWSVREDGWYRFSEDWYRLFGSWYLSSVVNLKHGCFTSAPSSRRRHRL